MNKVYLASPFFTPSQLELVEKVETILRGRGDNVFSPRENQIEDLEYATIPWRTAVFNNDIKHVQWCDYVVAIVAEGNYCDSGTAMEIGYAYGIQKPVIVMNPTENTVNLMIADSLHAYLPSWEALKEYDFSALPVKPYVGGVI